MLIVMSEHYVWVHADIIQRFVAARNMCCARSVWLKRENHLLQNIFDLKIEQFVASLLDISSQTSSLGCFPDEISGIKVLTNEKKTLKSL